MNLLHMKYAVEIAKTNSLNKAAETLYVGHIACPGNRDGKSLLARLLSVKSHFVWCFSFRLPYRFL